MIYIRNILNQLLWNKSILIEAKVAELLLQSRSNLYCHANFFQVTLYSTD